MVRVCEGEDFEGTELLPGSVKFMSKEANYPRKIYCVGEEERGIER